VPAGRGDLSVQETTNSCPRKINSLLYLTIPHLLTQIAPLGRGLIPVPPFKGGCPQGGGIFQFRKQQIPVPEKLILSYT